MTSENNNNTRYANYEAINCHSCKNSILSGFIYSAENPRPGYVVVDNLYFCVSDGWNYHVNKYGSIPKINYLNNYRIENR